MYQNTTQNCNKLLRTKNSFKKIQKDFEISQINIFLSACHNFNTNKQNLQLLLYGYIHFEIQDILLYNIIPLEIVQLCSLFCYDLKIVNEKFMRKRIKRRKENILSSHKYYNNIFRRLWILQITEHDLNTTLKLECRIDTTMYVQSANDIGFTSNNIKIGDNIYVLLIKTNILNMNDSYGWELWLKYNDKVFKNNAVEMHSDYRDYSLKLNILSNTKINISYS